MKTNLYIIKWLHILSEYLMSSIFSIFQNLGFIITNAENITSHKHTVRSTEKCLGPFQKFLGILS